VLVAFSPQTREVQFDEKWAFVGKKQQHCDPSDPADREQGDNWDHVAFDPTHRLVVRVVPGKRTAAKTDALVKEVHRRTGGRMLDLLVSNASPAYKPAMLHTYGETITPPRTGKPGRPKKPYTVAPAGLLMRQCPRPDTRGAWSMWNRVWCLARRQPSEQRWQLHP